MTTNRTRRWERGIVALVLTAAVALTGTVSNTAQAVDGPVDIVYIATGNNFADALVASVVAAMNGAPLLTVKSPGDFGDEIPKPTADKLTELKPAKIIVFGGPAAVSDKVYNELKAFTSTIERIEGDDRFETAALIADLVPDAVKHAFFADEAGDADTLDGKDSTDFLGATDQAVDSDTLDGLDSTEFLGAGPMEIVHRHWGTAAFNFSHAGGTFVVPAGDGVTPVDMFAWPTVPTEIAGVPYSWESTEFCFSIGGTRTVTALQSAIVEANGDYGPVAQDSTGWSTSDCVTLSAGGPYTLDASRSIVLALIADGDTGSINLTSTTIRLVPTTAGHLSTAASTPNDQPPTGLGLL